MEYKKKKNNWRKIEKLRKNSSESWINRNPVKFAKLNKFFFKFESLVKNKKVSFHSMHPNGIWMLQLKWYIYHDCNQLKKTSSESASIKLKFTLCFRCEHPKLLNNKISPFFIKKSAILIFWIIIFSLLIYIVWLFL